jgi:K+-sensing histidine kinase KdpD
MATSRPTAPFSIPATYFASPERAGEQEIRDSLRLIGNSELLNFAMELLDGWVAVLNAHRQVLAVNHSFLTALGIDDPGRVLGMRPGEVLRCVHAKDNPAGCGTSRFCRTCGAVIAIVGAQETGQAQDRECILSFEKNGESVDRTFSVRSCPIRVSGRPLVLISMKDVTEEKRRAMLERSFLHDLGNLLLGLEGGVMALRQGHIEAAEPIYRAMDTLIREVRVQQALVRGGSDARLETTLVRPSQVLSELEAITKGHGESHEQTILFQCADEDEPWETDLGLLLRVLRNMVINALEAGQPGDTVRVRAETTTRDVVFHVWNRQAIPEEVMWRIFQRSFTTKQEPGRGMGTFAMRLLGERLLKGTVAFTSTPAEGTTFRIRLPREWQTKA